MKVLITLAALASKVHSFSCGDDTRFGDEAYTAEERKK
jgi:hypothetical protein